MALTQEQVDNAPARNNWLADGEGLLLRTSAKGGRAWYWHRRIDGKQKRTKIASAKEMTLLEARAHVRRGGGSLSMEAKLRAVEAENLVLEARLAEVRAENRRLWDSNLRMTGQVNALVDTMRGLGLRPERARTAHFKQDGTVELRDFEAVERQGVNVETLAERWFELRESDWSPGSRKAYRHRVRKVTAQFGQRNADEVTPREIASFLNAAPSRSTRTVLAVILRGLFGLAVAEGHMQSNPAEAAKALLRNGDCETKHRPALPVEDAPAFYAGLGDSRAENALKLVMLTAVRIGAVEGGSAEEVKGDVWAVDPARQSKGKRSPRVPLTAAALACLDGLGESAQSIRTVIADKPFSVHGMRSTFRQWCQRTENADVSFEAKETALGHTVGTATQRAYERDDLLEERRALMQRWADYLTGKA